MDSKQRYLKYLSIITLLALLFEGLTEFFLYFFMNMSTDLWPIVLIVGSYSFPFILGYLLNFRSGYMKDSDVHRLILLSALFTGISLLVFWYVFKNHSLIFLMLLLVAGFSAGSGIVAWAERKKKAPANANKKIPYIIYLIATTLFLIIVSEVFEMTQVTLWARSHSFPYWAWLVYSLIFVMGLVFSMHDKFSKTAENKDVSKLSFIFGIVNCLLFVIFYIFLHHVFSMFLTFAGLLIGIAVTKQKVIKMTMLKGHFLQ